MQRGVRGAHEQAPGVVVEELATDVERGLSSDEAARRLRELGPNRLTPKKEQGPVIRFLLQFHAPLVYILIAAGATTAALQEYVDAFVILGVVLVNAIVGFVQESKAISAIDALSKSLSQVARVRRDSAQRDISAEGLVPGDIVLLQSGDKVPADIRLVNSRNLMIDESALTGESLPVEKSPDTLPGETVLADRRNMVYASTLVTYGTGVGVVVQTGDESEIGRISEMMNAAEDLVTPLTRRIARFSNILLIVILVLAAFTFAVGVLRDQPWLQTVLAAVALAVGAIPEGLPAAVTVMLAIGVSRMAKQRAVIRRLPAVETLGSTTVICTDKTGTLTHNQMTVRDIYAGGVVYEVSGQGYAPDGAIRVRDSESRGGAPAGEESLAPLLACGLLCNDAVLTQENHRWTVAGDPTEGALIVSAMKHGLERPSLEREQSRLDAIPFESDYQYMATLHRVSGAEPPCRIYLKGAVEKVLARCDSALGFDGARTALDRAALQALADGLANQGRRVLAFALKETRAETLDHGDVADGCTFLGFQAMIDPPREEAAAAVAACKTAGIQIKMITGDHITTASAIAREIGIGVDQPSQTPVAFSGVEMEAMDDPALADAAARGSVFARVTPESKLRLVKALQKQGHVVAMTGDGVNDAPAVRTADIGVAMALGGTEVAREAADMVLTDDNFATIQAAVKEGRGIFDNLVKFITWTLPTNMGQGLVLLAAVVLNMDLPILPVQVLWINMTTVVTLGTMLAFEPSEENLMRRPPRDPKSPLLPGNTLAFIALVSILLCSGAFYTFATLTAEGYGVTVARTAAAGFIVFADILYLHSSRSLTRPMFLISPLSNGYIWLGIAAMTLLQAAFTYLPAMNNLFHTELLAAPVLWRIALVGALFIVAVELGKYLLMGRATMPAAK